MVKRNFHRTNRLIGARNGVKSAMAMDGGRGGNAVTPVTRSVGRTTSRPVCGRRGCRKLPVICWAREVNVKFLLGICAGVCADWRGDRGVFLVRLCAGGGGR